MITDTNYKRCESCKYAEWEEVGTDRGSYFVICGCTSPQINEIDEEYGDCKDCPFWISRDN